MTCTEINNAFTWLEKPCDTQMPCADFRQTVDGMDNLGEWFSWYDQESPRVLEEKGIEK